MTKPNPKPLKKYHVEALATAIFYIQIEAHNMKEARQIADNLTMLDEKYPTDDYNFDSDFRIANVEEISQRNLTLLTRKERAQ